MYLGTAIETASEKSRYQHLDSLFCWQLEPTMPLNAAVRGGV